MATVTSVLESTSSDSPERISLKLYGTESSTIEREHLAVAFHDCFNGIGIKAIGGTEETTECGIFIKRILRNKLAANDGRLLAGDQILRVNGQPFENITYTQALSLLRAAASTGHVTLVVSRDARAQKQYQQLMDEELTTASDTSRATSPSNSVVTENSDHLETGTSPVTTPRSSGQSTPVPEELETVNQLMNNSMVRDNSARGANSRPDIVRLSNRFPTDLGAGRMASTPYDPSKVPNRMKSPVKLANNHSHPNTGPSISHIVRDQQTTAGATSLNVSMDLYNKSFEIEKLESALGYLGLHLTQQQRLMLRSQLRVDHDGRVQYEEFVAKAQELFPHTLEPREMTLSSEELVNPSVRPIQVQAAASVQIIDASSRHELTQIQMENQSLRKQLHIISKKLHEQKTLTANTEKGLIQYRMMAQTSVEEADVLRDKLTLATESQKLADQQERELENIIAGLEKEIQRLTENEEKQIESPVVRKRLAVLGSQLRKSEETRQAYQVTTHKLLEFCQYIHDVMSGSITDNNTPQMLTAECRDTMSAVRSIIEKNPLPFGWEECFDSTGTRYFINHVTQETSWRHPLSKSSR